MGVGEPVVEEEFPEVDELVELDVGTREAITFIPLINSHCPSRIQSNILLTRKMNTGKKEQEEEKKGIQNCNVIANNKKECK